MPSRSPPESRPPLPTHLGRANRQAPPESLRPCLELPRRPAGCRWRWRPRDRAAHAAAPAPPAPLASAPAPRAALGPGARLQGSTPHRSRDSPLPHAPVAERINTTWDEPLPLPSLPLSLPSSPRPSPSPLLPLPAAHPQCLQLLARLAQLLLQLRNLSHGLVLCVPQPLCQLRHRLRVRGGRQAARSAGPQSGAVPSKAKSSPRCGEGTPRTGQGQSPWGADPRAPQ